MYQNLVVLAIPRFKPGVPFTLGVASLDKSKYSVPLIRPFNGIDQRVGNCSGLQNVVDIALDSENILWVLDIGVVNTFESATRKCSPKIVAFDLNTSGKVCKDFSQY